jgi:hypothetical protein
VVTLLHAAVDSERGSGDERGKIRNYYHSVVMAS